MIDHIWEFLSQQVALQVMCARDPERPYVSPADYVLDRGRESSGAWLPRAGRRFERLAEASAHYLQPKQCFYNAQMIGLKLMGLGADVTYVEGWASGNLGFPVHHGWLEVEGSVLFDPTWRVDPNGGDTLDNRVLGRVPDGWAYFGIEVDMVEMGERILDTEESYCFLYDTRRPEWMAYLDKKRRGPRDHKITSLIEMMQREKP